MCLPVDVSSHAKWITSWISYLFYTFALITLSFAPQKGLTFTTTFPGVSWHSIEVIRLHLYFYFCPEGKYLSFEFFLDLHHVEKNKTLHSKMQNSTRCIWSVRASYLSCYVHSKAMSFCSFNNKIYLVATSIWAQHFNFWTFYAYFVGPLHICSILSALVKIMITLYFILDTCVEC